MENTDFELINRTISGDQDAFSTLVRKYQSGCTRLHGEKLGISMSPKISHRIPS